MVTVVFFVLLFKAASLDTRSKKGVWYFPVDRDNIMRVESIQYWEKCFRLPG